MSLLLPSVLLAQLPEVPAQNQFTARADYQAYRDQAAALSRTLFDLAPGREMAWKAEASRFISNWLSGNPLVKVESSPAIDRLEEKNPGMRLLYAAGCIRYALSNPGPQQPRDKIATVLGWMMDYYDQQPGIHRDRYMKKMMAARREGRLDQWIQAEMNLTD